MANDVQTRLTAENAQFDAAMEQSAQKVTATGAASEKASKRAADAQKFASQFISEAVSKQTGEQVAAMQRVRAAQEDFNRAQKIVRAGYLDESEAAQTLGAALQRLTTAQKASAEASGRIAAANAESAKGFKDVAERVVLSSVGYIAAATGIRDILGGMKEAVTSSLEFGESISRASQKTNLSVGALSTLHYAAKVTGGDFDALTKGVGKLDVSIAQAANGNKEMGGYFKDLGLNAKELNNNSEGAQIALQRLSSVLANTSGPERQLVAQKLLSRAGIDQIPTLMDLADHWDEYTNSAKASGNYLTGSTAAALAATNERLRAMELRIQGAKLAFTEGLIPGLTAFAGALEGGKSGLTSFNNLGVQTARVVSGITAQVFALAASMDTIKAHALDSNLSFGSIGNKLQHPFTASWTDPNGYQAKQLAAAARERAKAEQLMKIANGEPGAVPPVSAPAKSDGPKPVLHVVDPAAAAAAEAAAKKAAEAKMKRFEAQLADMKLEGTIEAQSVKAEYDFWQQRIDAFTKGSDQYNAIREKQAALAMAASKAAGEKLAAAMKKFKETADLSPDEANRGIAENAVQVGKTNDAITQSGERWKEYNQQVAKNTELMIKSAQAAREAQIEHGVKAGTLSKSDAAQQMGAIHAETAAMQIAELRRQLADVQKQQAALNVYTPEGAAEKPRLAAQGQGIQNQIDTETASANLQALKDRYAAFAETGLGGATSALQAFIAASRDSAAQLRQVIDSVMNNVNKAILTDLTEKHSQSRGAWKDAGKGIFTDVASTALKKGEGALLGALGGGKLGSRGNPIFVKNADGLASGAASVAAKSLSSSGGLMSGLLKSVIGFLPAFADGGDFGPGTTALVGEQGPEVVHFGSAGHVTPNGKAPSTGGSGDTHHTWNIDARGSTDPAQTMAMVQQGIMQAAPHIVAASLKAHQDYNDRRPPSARM
jgi:hypothetical protein